MAENKVGAVLVAGGGIAGIQAALDLAESGFRVYLLDSSPSIGGTMAQLDKTFPTNDCSMCIMAPKLVAAGRHLNIELLTNAEVKGVSGQAGDFTIEVLKKARYIYTEKCTGCGVCAQRCPVDAISRFNEGLGARRAVYIPYPQAVPLTFVIDREKCIGCGLCKNLCLADAVKYEDKDETVKLKVGSIILAPGFEEFDAQLKREYGYGVFPNVVSSIQFERILSASGPYKGTVLRPSDGSAPKKIAFIQCVGSRDPHVGRDYCSSVCCMYATKEAVIAKEHAGKDLDATIFFMDIRAHGKDFDRYYERAEKEYGVRYIRARVANIEELPETQSLSIKYETDEGKLLKENFDLIVLSVGLSPQDRIKEMAEQLGVELNQYQFCKTEEFQPIETSKPGVLVIGAFQGPKDIPETVTQASAAAALAGGLLAGVRNSLVIPKEYPPETPVTGEPRIGVFVCHCGINIGGFVKVPEVVAYAKTLPGVSYVEENLYTCSQDTQKKIKEKIKEHKLNRVIVASCTPRTHEPLFQETIRDAGLNRSLFEMANIRDQCSWIHMQEKESATRKAKDLVRMACAKGALIEPLKTVSLPVVPRAVVIGGGLAGMVSARAIADQGFETAIVEKEGRLGGNLNHIYFTLEGNDVQEYLKNMIQTLEHHPKIKIYKNSEIESVKGFVGNYKTTIKTKNGPPEELEHGVFVVATGAVEWRPDEYFYGRDERVITQLELEKLLVTPDSKIKAAKTVVMVQCVGSRDEKHPYCSRTCCSDAIKNSLRIKALNPDARVFILYRDIRTYGFKERFYEEARAQGVVFVRYEGEEKPLVSRDGADLKVLVKDILLQDKLMLDTDLLILSAATIPPVGNEELAKLLKVPLNQDGFFLEAHVKLRPVDFATEGVFLAGMAHSPKPIDEAIGQAQAAAGRAVVIISKDKYTAEPIIASVNEELCAGCGICTSICEYNAPELITEIKDGKEVRRSKVNEALCKGCGTCAAACPSGAMEQLGFKKQQLWAMVDAALSDAEASADERAFSEEGALSDAQASADDRALEERALEEQASEKR
jgi:heterodisulfide reductase subunit A